jgi:hypothetical protein
MSTPTAGHGTAMVRTRVLAVFKTADVDIVPLREFDKSHMIINSARLAGSVRQTHGFAVWRTSIGFGPGFFAGEQLVWIREGFRSD